MPFRNSQKILKTGQRLFRRKGTPEISTRKWENLKGGHTAKQKAREMKFMDNTEPSHRQKLIRKIKGLESASEETVNQILNHLKQLSVLAFEILSRQNPELI